MSASPVSLEQILAVEGDPLYRIALLLGGDERVAARLLGYIASHELRGWSQGDDQAALIGALYAAAQRQPKPRRPGPPPSNPALPPLFQRVLRLPLDQRLALGLRLLLGYDSARLAAAGLPPDQSGPLYATALRSLAPAARVQISDYGPETLCTPVRAAISEATGQLSGEPALRGHLASCSHCRAFDHTWAELARAVERALREQLRYLALPAPLRARMLEAARPSAHAARPRLRLLLVPLAVLTFIIALAAPGFWRSTQVVVERGAAAALDPHALIDRALVAADQLPNGSGVYNARYETLWFFDDQVFAPIRAELWVDASNPARHRLEIAHAEGGAPYELQIGDGRARMAYRSTREYARSLYGELPVDDADLPVRLEALDQAAQAKARLDRMAAGAWSIGHSYLRDAAQANDLRSLGRQRDGQRTVQILSYTGSSPLGRPVGAPGATAERVTVLLALDLVDSRLRRATELAGPPGAGQTSNITWRLADEQWISAPSISEPLLNINQEWQRTGSELPALTQTIVDPALPLIRRDQLAPLAALLNTADNPLPWLPSALPPGTDRAMLFLDAGQRDNLPSSVAYFGPGRAMFLHLRRIYRGVHHEDDSFGTWNVFLEPSHQRRYTIGLQHVGLQPSPTSARPPDELRDWMVIEASGFTRAELQAVVESLRPFDNASLQAQEHLFMRPDNADPAARAALLELLSAAPPLSADSVRYERSRLFQRHNPAPDPLADPYHRPPYDGTPDTLIVEQWAMLRDGQPVGLLRLSDPADGALVQQFYQSDTLSWRYEVYPDMLTLWPRTDVEQRDLTALSAHNLLASTGELLLLDQPDGSRAIVQRSRSQRLPAIMQARNGGAQALPYLADMQQPAAVRLLRLGSDGRLASFSTFLGDESLLELSASETQAAQMLDALSTGALIERSELEESANIAPEKAPPALLSGEPPQAALTRDLTASQSEATIMVRSVSFAEALAEWDGPTYLLPETVNAAPVMAEIGRLTLRSGRVSEMPGGEAAAHGLAVRFAYLIPKDAGTETLWVTSGDAATLRAYFYLYSRQLWEASQPVQLTVAGRSVEAWLMRGTSGAHAALFAEIDGTLIIAEGRSAWFEAEALPLLAELRLAQ